MTKTYIKLILFVVLFIYGFKSCFMYSEMSHLTDEELEWVTLGRKNLVSVFHSDSGSVARMSLDGSNVGNTTNPIAPFAHTFEVSSEYEAFAWYSFEIRSKVKIINGSFMISKPIDSDSLSVSSYLGRLYSNDDLFLIPKSVTYLDRDFNDCFVADRTNCHFGVGYEEDSMRVEEYTISKRYGLIYYKLSNGEKFYRVFN